MDTYETINRLEAQGTGVVLQLSAHDLRCVVGEIMRSEREKMSREAKEAAEYLDMRGWTERTITLKDGRTFTIKIADAPKPENEEE